MIPPQQKQLLIDTIKKPASAWMNNPPQKILAFQLAKLSLVEKFIHAKTGLFARIILWCHYSMKRQALYRKNEIKNTLENFKRIG